MKNVNISKVFTILIIICVISFSHGIFSQNDSNSKFEVQDIEIKAGKNITGVTPIDYEGTSLISFKTIQC